MLNNRTFYVIQKFRIFADVSHSNESVDCSFTRQFEGLVKNRAVTLSLGRVFLPMRVTASLLVFMDFLANGVQVIVSVIMQNDVQVCSLSVCKRGSTVVVFPEFPL